MKKKVLSLVLTVVMAASMLAGCGGSSSGGGSGASSADSSSDTLVFAQAADPRSLDPAFADDGESTKINTNIYEGLVKYADKTTDIEPCLAESWDVSEDGLTYTFHLRQGIKFHDGTDFNAEAVKVNFDRQLPGNATEDMPYAGFVFSLVDEVTVDDEYTVSVHLTEAQTPFLANLAMIQGAPIVSPKALEENNNNVTNAPCGTGPYKFVSWDTDQSVVLVRNDDYWGEPAKIKNVVFRIIPDNSARVIALNNGEADIIDGIDATVVDQIEEAGNKVQTDEAMMTNYMGFNTTDGVFTDVEARRAICQAINVPELVQTLYQGYDTPATSFLPESLPGYDDSIGFLNEDIPMTRAGYSIDYDWNANFTVRGTAVFNHLPKSTTFYTCYQPIGVYFTYQKNTSSADIRSIEVKYNCDGAVYTYPGYSSLGYNVEYEIPVKRISPAENTMYSKSDPYDTDKVIFTGVGGSYASQYLTFTVNDSGTEYRQTFRFYY